MSFALHTFVESTDNCHGIGQLVEIDGDESVVAYFNSPAEEDLHYERVSTSNLVVRPLEPQSRVYRHDPETLDWQVGRVLGHQPTDGQYLVQFPNSAPDLISETVLRIRWDYPIDNPTDLLALQLNQTPFWHGGRSALIESVFTQKYFSFGLAAALSSSIELVKHQLAVVRNVLHDPFQRYLLADEVGLGKTIEAGILIRQFALDEPTSHETLVIVPEPLRMQWEQELKQQD